MADTQDPSIGWGGSIKIHNGTDLYELKNVIDFNPPAVNRTRVDSTHLKSAGMRMESIPGLYESNECSGTLHYRAGSDTDVLLRAAAAAGNDRACELIVPLAGEADFKQTCTAIVTSYEPPKLEAGALMVASFTLLIESEVTQAAVTP